MTTAKKKSTAKGKKKSTGAKNLVIVESPAKSRTINKFLGKDYQVEASLGHVRDLPKSRFGVDIPAGFVPQYIVSTKSRKTVSHLKKAAAGKERIYLAPDPDREGEAISWHLAHLLKEANGAIAIERVVFNEITQKAVQDAFRHSREIDINLVNAQQARRILDRILGYELSPLLWKKVGRGLSAGRVQTVALRLIVEREREIRKFVPAEYWTLEAKLSSRDGKDAGKAFIARLDRIGEEKADLKSKEQTRLIRDEILCLPFQVSKVEKKERQKRPQAPYTTSKLQQEAYTRLGFPAAKTMQIAQRLYEGVEIGEEGSIGLITYMRTDSVNIAKEAQAEAAEYIKNRFGNEYFPAEPPVYRSKKGAQEAHEAIRPTAVMRDPETLRPILDQDEFRLYELIWKKFVASQMVPGVDEVVQILISAGDKYSFRASGRRNLFPGFTAVFSDIKTVQGPEEKKEGASPEEEEPEETEFPDLAAGEILNLHELIGYQHFTKPPARFNDASLVKILEEEGIGRPSTYAPTLYTLLNRFYVNRKGGALVPSELGETVVDVLVQFFPDILNVGFTAQVEEELDKIEEGEHDWVSLLKRFYDPFSVDLEKARQEMKDYRQEPQVTEYLCDRCGKAMLIRQSRFGKFLACSGFPDCKSTRSIPLGVSCPEPNCGGDLVRKRSKKGRAFYACSKYPQCTYITNKLPRKDDETDEDPGIKPSAKLEVLGP